MIPEYAAVAVFFLASLTGFVSLTYVRYIWRFAYVGVLSVVPHPFRKKPPKKSPYLTKLERLEQNTVAAYEEWRDAVVAAHSNGNWERAGYAYIDYVHAAEARDNHLLAPEGFVEGS